MSGKHDKAFYQQRNETFDRVIALAEGRVRTAVPSILVDSHEMSPEDMRIGAEREAWSLFLRGLRHLKDGAPGSGPGTMTEALSQASLRSSSFAAALGVKPPQFEQMLFGVDYTSGHEAALFFCRRLAEAAEGDLSKSRQIIQQKILAEKPADPLKRQMAFSFGVLADTYGQACRDFKSALATIPPAARTRPEKGFDF